MKDFPIEALVEIVERETVMLRNDVQYRDGISFDPRTPAYIELCNRFDRASETVEQPASTEQTNGSICADCGGDGTIFTLGIWKPCTACDGTGKLHHS